MRILLLLLLILAGCDLPNDHVKNSEFAMSVEQVTPFGALARVMRLENQEAVCYSLSDGTGVAISCIKKDK